MLIESSFVIPVWFKKGQKGKEHSAEVLWWAWKCLKRVLEVTPRDKFELIIVDNGSDNFLTKDDNGTIISTEEYFKHADVLIRNEENLGYGGGMSAGIAVAKGKYIFCLENDVLPFPGWYEGMISAFSIDDKIGLVQPWSVPFRGKRVALTIKYDDPNLTWTGKKMYEWGKEWGAVHCTPKWIFEEIKRRYGYYFNPIFKRGYCEDKNLYKEIRVLGKETLRTYYSAVFHSTGTSFAYDPDAKRRMYSNRILLRERWNKK